jgi:hypothetical protein
MPDVLHAIAARVRALMAEEPVFDVVSRAHVCGPIIHAGEVLGAFDTGILVWVRLSYRRRGSLGRSGCWLLSDTTSEIYVLLKTSKEATHACILLRSRKS